MFHAHSRYLCPSDDSYSTNWLQKFKVCKSANHYTIPINEPTKCNNFSSLLLDVYVQLNMFRASSIPSSGAQQLQQQPLVLPLERGGSSAVGRGRAGCQPARPRLTTDLGFESHRGHGYLSVVSVVCCQVEVSATSWSLVQRSPSDCAASLCVI